MRDHEGRFYFSRQTGHGYREAKDNIPPPHRAHSLAGAATVILSGSLIRKPSSGDTKRLVTRYSSVAATLPVFTLGSAFNSSNTVRPPSRAIFFAAVTPTGSVTSSSW